MLEYQCLFGGIYRLRRSECFFKYIEQIFGTGVAKEMPLGFWELHQDVIPERIEAINGLNDGYITRVVRGLIEIASGGGSI